MLKESHDTGFMVAGAAQADLLSDLFFAIQTAIDDGTTLETFRKQFDKIVEKYGWKYKGGRNWRTEVIFDTNMHAARAAGRWEQYQQTKTERPILMYISVRDLYTRHEHFRLHKTVRPIDDDFWKYYYPPNGHGCRCNTISFSYSQLKRHKLSITKVPNLGHYTWTHPETGEQHIIPGGIDPGFNYAPGKYAYNLKETLKEKADKMPPEIAKKLKQDIGL